MSLLLDQVSIYQADQALFNPVDLQVNPGEIATVMGPSGSGKSTLLAAICGNLDPVFSLSGRIVLNNRDLFPLPMEERKVGILFQDDLLFPHLDVFGNMAFALPAGLSRREKCHRVQAALAGADLRGFERRDIGTLSGGQRARVSLLRTLLAEPEAILLDEPFAKLDRQLKKNVREFIFSRIIALNIPAVLVTHDINDAPNNQIHELSGGLMNA